MAWQDRLREAAYTSPAGLRMPFTYEDVRYKVKKRTTAYEFPDAPGTYIQQLGAGGRRYPMRVVFWGKDCDLEAATFEDALMESGIGKLEHPMYGTVNVVPFGEITREDRLKTEANQVVINLTFFETTGLVYPEASTSPAQEVLSSVAKYNEAQAVEFEEFTEVETASEQAVFKSKYATLLTQVKGSTVPGAETGLAKIAATTASVEAQFNTVVDSIQLGIDVLVQDPLTLAFQTAILIQAPARAAAAISDRLDAYWHLMNLLIDGGSGDNENAFRTVDLYASAYMTGPIIAVVNNTFETKTEALEAAEAILDQMQVLTAWRDENLDGLDVIDPGGAYQRLQEAVAVAAGFLVEISFTLKQEKRIVLDRARTVLDLAAEVYGDVDGQLDFLISSNNLTGSEILELPRGRAIVYYV